MQGLLPPEAQSEVFLMIHTPPVCGIPALLLHLGDRQAAGAGAGLFSSQPVHPPRGSGAQSGDVSGYHKNNRGPTPGRPAGQVQEGRGEK